MDKKKQASITYFISFFLSFFALIFPLFGSDDLQQILQTQLDELTREKATAKPLTTFILVRHAEKQKEGGRNPNLNKAGQARAMKLKEMLQSVEITHIFSTNYKRTQQTVLPLAKQLNLHIQTYEPMDVDIFKNIQKKQAGSVVLIVGHSNTIPRLVNGLIEKEQYEDFEEMEYDNLFVLTLGGKGKAKVLNLKF